MKYEFAEIKIISLKEDILTLSLGGTQTDEGWGNLNFGGAKNSPLANLANSIADKL